MERLRRRSVAVGETLAIVGDQHDVVNARIAVDMGNFRSRCPGAIAEIPLEVPDCAIGITGAFGIQADRLAEASPSGNCDLWGGWGIDRHHRHGLSAAVG
jgi:hypothetical protein